MKRSTARAMLFAFIVFDLVLACTAGVLLTQVMQNPAPTAVSSVSVVKEIVELQVQAPASVQVGEEFQLIAGLKNPGPGRLTSYEILLPRALFECADLVSVSPQVSSPVDVLDQIQFGLEAPLAEGETSHVIFTLKAKHSLNLSGTVEVHSGAAHSSAGVRLVIAGSPPQAAEAVSAATESQVSAESIVQITALYTEFGKVEEAWIGSGTIISPDGLILTNAHVALPSKYFPVDNLKVSLTVSPDQPAVPAYYAEVLQADRELDIAVIRIHQDIDGSPVDRAYLNLPAVALGDSRQLNLGDTLVIMGYPGIGGETITLTRGEVAGFTSEEKYGDRAFIKTSATIAGGNSGGLAANGQGQLVGIPTQLGYGGEESFVDCRIVADTNGDGQVNGWDSCIPTGGFINALRPIHLARPLIEAAQRGEVNIIEPERPKIPLPKGGVIYYSDDFSNVNSGWTYQGDLFGVVGYQSGEYQVEVKSTDGGFYWGVANKPQYADVVINVKSRIVTPNGGGYYGVMCRYQDPLNFYLAALSEDGYFGIFKVVDGEYAVLADWDYSLSIPKYAGAELTVACSGSTITLAVDDTVLGQVTDSDLTSGDIGLIGGANGLFIVAYDDLEVKSP